MLISTSECLIIVAGGVYFASLLRHAFLYGEIKGRSGFISSKYYSRENEPFFFWINVVSYSVCIVFIFVGSILLLRK